MKTSISSSHIRAFWIGMTMACLPVGVLHADQFGVFTYYEHWTSITITDCSTSTMGPVVIPATIVGKPVTSIGRSAFSLCSSLTSVTIPSSVTNIGEDAFSVCASLSSVTIPSSVRGIGNFAFIACNSLASAIFAGDAPAVGANVFDFVAPDFTVYYLTGTTGFTSPTWYGVPSVEIDQSVHPAAIWLLTHGLPYDTNLHQDLNGDGITLLTSYAQNLDPHNALAGMPVPILGSGTLSLTFYGAAQGVTYGAVSSTDLQNWGTVGVTLSAPDPDGMRTATIDTTAPRRFMRLVIAEE